MSKFCKHIKPDRQRCQAAPMEGAEYCYFHSPEKAKERAEARKKGGVNRRVGGRTNPGHYSIRTASDIMAILEIALNDAATLENSHSRIRSMGYLCGIALKGLEVSELEARVSALEERLNNGGKKK